MRLIFISLLSLVFFLLCTIVYSAPENLDPSSCRGPGTSLNNYVDFGSDSTLDDVYSSFRGGAMSFWLYMNTLPNSGFRYYYYKGAENWLRIQKVGGNKDLIFFRGYNGTDGQWSWRNVIPEGEWIFVHLNYASTLLGGGGNPDLFLNGVEQTETVDSTPTGNVNTDNGSPLRIFSTGLTAEPDGLMCYWQAHRTMLTDNEANEIIYNPGSIKDQLVLYAPLWGQDLTEPDLSGNGNTGAVTGTSRETDGPPVMLGGGMNQ
jgi:hypothetical protein